MDPTNPVSPEVPLSQPEKKDGHWIAIAAMALFVAASLVAVGFLYYQNQQLKSMLASYQTQTTPTPIATADPTVDWKTYTNTKFGFSLKYPQSWEVAQNPNEAPISTTDIKRGPGFEVVLLDKTVESTCGPYVCYPSIQIATPQLDNSKIKLSLENWLQKYIASKSPDLKFDSGADFIKLTIDGNPAIKFNDSAFISRNNYIYIVSFEIANTEQKYDKEVFDQILSTFKLQVTPIASPQATQKACTLEAKLCPDGSSVGRTGPNCEFAACP